MNREEVRTLTVHGALPKNNGKMFVPLAKKVTFLLR
jgi:hypothetical protein